MMAINNVEFLRYLIDFIDSGKNQQADNGSEMSDDASSITISMGQQEEPEQSQRVMPAQQAAFIPGEDGEAVETALDRDDVFVPPLQAKLEMMKKLAGIESKNQELLNLNDEDLLDN